MSGVGTSLYYNGYFVVKLLLKLAPTFDTVHCNGFNAGLSAKIIIAFLNLIVMNRPCFEAVCSYPPHVPDSQIVEDQPLFCFILDYVHNNILCFIYVHLTKRAFNHTGVCSPFIWRI